jgi:GNAT superfamily N-acetyltransferase
MSILKIPSLTFETYGDVESMVSIKLILKKQRIVYACISFNGCAATLIDIVIVKRTVPYFFWFPYIKKSQNYRGKGYGTALLNEVIAYCRSNGIKSIQGKAMGEHPKTDLLGWYKSKGFEVTNGNNIYIEL